MAQALPRYCPRCGTPTQADMQRCATCNLPVGAMLGRPNTNSGDYQSAPLQGASASTPGHMQQGNEAYFSPKSPRSYDFQADWASTQEPAHSPLPSGGGNGNALGQPGMQQSWSTPAQPSAPRSWDAPGNSYPPNNPGSQGNWNNQAQPFFPPMPTPAPRKRLRAGRLFLVLFLFLLLAGGGLFAFLALGGHLLNATQASIKTTNLNKAVTYAGVTITVLNVQQSQNFTDDPQSSNNGMLRLILQEQNPSSVTITWDYNQSARLIAQGKPALAPAYITANGSLAPGASRKNTIDFAVANGGDLSTLVFQLGTNKEAQIQLPLAGQTNLSQYQPQTMPQKGKLSYFGLDWTLASTTTSLSQPGQQASNGMEFLTVDLTIDNTLSQQAISGSAFDYMRIKIGGKTIAPISTNVPVSFAAGDVGKKGSATFIVPQNSTTCTLLMLSQDTGTSGQAKVNFQIG